MNNKQEKSFRPSGRLNSVFVWPIALGILLIIIDFILYFINIPAASVVAVFTFVYICVCAFMILYFRPRIIKEIVEFSSNYSQVQRQLLYDLSIPYCLLDNKGNILWMNSAMQHCISKKNDYNKNISTIIPELSTNVFRNFDDYKEVRVALNDRDYKIEMKRISADILTQGVNILSRDYNSSLVAMYMFDETDVNKYIQKIRDERFVVGLVYIDNYEDALESVDDVRRSLFVGLVDKRVNKYFSAGAAIIRKMEKDKYLVVFRYKFLERILSDKFSLGRGGDQAVIKDGDKIYYYGGKSQQMEKNTRVKVRVKAHALRQILEANDNVLIMGHSLPDIDSFGSALGIYIIAKKLGKEAHIVFGEVSTSVRPFMNRFINKEEYPDDMFISKDNAESYIKPSTVVIVVDVNRAQRTECPILLDKCKTVIVFDHHRRLQR